MGPRFSIIPGRAVMDERLSETQLRVLCALGRHFDSDGWCEISQKKTASLLGYSRETVNRSIKALVDFGYIQKKDGHRDDGGQAISLYRVLHDTELEQKGVTEESQRGVTLCDHRGCDACDHTLNNDSSISSEPNGSSDTDVPLSDRRVIEEAVNSWNQLAEEIGHPLVQRMNASRKSKLKARLAECGGLDGWAIALEKIRGSPFCRGDSKSGWLIDFDALCQAKTFTRLMEGSYDPRPHKANRSFPDERGGSAQDRQMAAFVSVGAERSGLDGT